MLGRLENCWKPSLTISLCSWPESYAPSLLNTEGYEQINMPRTNSVTETSTWVWRQTWWKSPHWHKMQLLNWSWCEPIALMFFSKVSILIFRVLHWDGLDRDAQGASDLLWELHYMGIRSWLGNGLWMRKWGLSEEQGWAQDKIVVTGFATELLL